MKKLKSKINYLGMFLAIMISLPIFSQRSMGLGDLQFVMPSEHLSRSSRTLTMKMATTGITPKFFAKVGGVAFIQTATPDFTINSLTLGCDFSKNNAYVIMNDTTYLLPLENWELQTIVEFADSENNAAVTLYGGKETPIKYHFAFLDNLMGLRILQTDLMLIHNIERGKFPSYSDGIYIMSDKEKKNLESWMLIDSLLYNLSYEDMSTASYYMFRLKADSIGEKYDTYIYTDYNEPISFYSDNGEIKFKGFPYYRFASRDSLLVDTLEMYGEIKNFVDTFNVHKKLLEGTYVENLFAKKNNKKIYDLAKITKKNKNVSKKAKDAFMLTDYYDLCDSISGDRQFIRYLYSVLIKFKIDEYTDSIVDTDISRDSELYRICKEYNSLKDSLVATCHYPIICEYANLISQIEPTDSFSVSVHKYLSEYDFSYNSLLIDYMYNNRTPGVIDAENLTSYFRENRTYITMLNPIIFGASHKVCHWSAFFRYIKENYYNQWQDFKEKVHKLKYDAPIVQTPISFKNE